MKAKEINKLLKDKNITHCYIRKGAYYRPDSCGYTDYVTKAGIYEKTVAIEHAKRCEELTLIPINNSEHNTRIISEVNDLLSRYINS